MFPANRGDAQEGVRGDDGECRPSHADATPHVSLTRGGDSSARASLGWPVGLAWVWWASRAREEDQRTAVCCCTQCRPRCRSMTPDCETPQFCGRLSRGFISSLVTSRHGPAHNGRCLEVVCGSFQNPNGRPTTSYQRNECDLRMRMTSTGSRGGRGSITNPVALLYTTSLKTPRAWEPAHVPDRHLEAIFCCSSTSRKIEHSIVEP